MDLQHIQNILEACLLVAGKAMSIKQLDALFEEDIDRPERTEIKEALLALQSSYEGRGIELVEVSSGWRLQSAASMEHWVGRLFQEKPPRYSRALLETLVLIAYRQPITRGEIEDVRGVAVSSNIIKTLQERDWVKEMGYKDVPGKPALWGTTKGFLDYFNLKRLDELPTLAEARDLAEIDAALAAEVGIVEGAAQGVAANDAVDDATGVNSDADVAEVDADDVPDAESDVDVALTDADGVTASDTDIAVVDGVSDAESRIDDVAAEVGDRADTGIGVDDVDIVVSDGSNGAEHSELSIADVANEAEDSEGKQPAAVESEDLAVLAAGLMRGSSDVQSGLTSLVDNFIDEREQDESAASSASQEAVEISAHDIVAEAWEPQPESTSNTDTPNVEFASADESKVDGVVNESDIFDEPTGPTESEDSSLPEGGNDSLNSGAQTQLRHVIEEFADEHQQQIDAQNLQLQQTVITKDSAHQPLSSKDASSDLASLEVETSTTGPTENQQGDLSTAHQKPTLYGLSGKIESELSDNELDRQHDKATDSRDAEP